jgi:hypothetical protein
MDRLAAAGRLWIAADYFHPWLAYRGIDWDAALIAAIPKITAAANAVEYAAAVQSILARHLFGGDRSMSLLRLALRLILGIDIRVNDASGRTRMIRSGLPGTVQQFHSAQFLENDATPIPRRPHRPQSAFTLPAILIAEHATFTGTIAAQPVRAKQAREILVNGSDRLLLRHRGPNQQVHVPYGLDLCLDDTPPNFTIPPRHYLYSPSDSL